MWADCDSERQRRRPAGAKRFRPRGCGELITNYMLWYRRKLESHLAHAHLHTPPVSSCAMPDRTYAASVSSGLPRNSISYPINPPRAWNPHMEPPPPQASCSLKLPTPRQAPDRPQRPGGRSGAPNQAEPQGGATRGPGIPGGERGRTPAVRVGVWEMSVRDRSNECCTDLVCAWAESRRVFKCA